MCGTSDVFSQARKWARLGGLVHWKHHVVGLEHGDHLRDTSAAVAQLWRLIRSRRWMWTRARSNIVRGTSSYVDFSVIDYIDLAAAPSSPSSSRLELLQGWGSWVQWGGEFPHSAQSSVTPQGLVYGCLCAHHEVSLWGSRWLMQVKEKLHITWSINT